MKTLTIIFMTLNILLSIAMMTRYQFIVVNNEVVVGDRWTGDTFHDEEID